MNNKVIIVKVSDRSNDGQSLKKACKIFVNTLK